MRWTSGTGSGDRVWRCSERPISSRARFGWSTRGAVSAPMRHWVAASAGDLHSLALRDISPRAADGRVTGPMSLPMTRACGYPMVAQTLRTLANPAGLMPRSHRRWATSKAWTARAQSPPCPRPHLPNPVLYERLHPIARSWARLTLVAELPSPRHDRDTRATTARSASVTKLTSNLNITAAIAATSGRPAPGRRFHAVQPPSWQHRIDAAADPFPLHEPDQ